MKVVSVCLPESLAALLAAKHIILLSYLAFSMAARC